MSINLTSLITMFAVIFCLPFTVFAERSVGTYTDNWSSSVEKISVGLGSKSNPYEITKSQHLAYLAKMVNEGQTCLNKYYVLKNDIDLYGKEWVAIGLRSDKGKKNNSPRCFSGILDGNNHNITNLHIGKRQSNNQGLFGTIYGGKIKNLNLINCTVTGKVNIGGIAGTSKFCLIKNCSVTGKINGQEYTGGLIGFSFKSKLEENCTKVNVNGVMHTGALVGSSNRDTLLNKCYALGDVVGRSYLGGLVGTNINSMVRNCYSRVNVTSQNFEGAYIGGLTGSNSGKIYGCFIAAAVKDSLETKAIVGNIAGYNNGSITRTYYAIEKTLKGVPIIGDNVRNKKLNESDWILNSENEKKLINSVKFLGLFGTTCWKIDSAKNDGYPYLKDVKLLDN